MNLFKRLFQKTSPKKLAQRKFIGSKPSPVSSFNTSYCTINNELKADHLALTLRARALYKNNSTVSSYINLMLRNVIGNTGFRLMVQSVNDDGLADYYANSQIENLWFDYATSIKKYVSLDQQMNAIDFDRHILFNLLIDGQVFIRKHRDNNSKYRIRFEVLDSLNIDTLYNINTIQDDFFVCMGIKVDRKTFKPISYFVRRNNNPDYYAMGQRQEVPASDIIHIYKKQFSGQIRGFTPLAPVIQSLAGLEQYRINQINASIISSCLMGVWEQSGGGNSYDDYDDDEIDSNGDVAQVLENQVFKFAPTGYKLNTVQSNHPNSNLGAFAKTCIKSIASALGVSSNKLNSDYQSVNYSSLRQANSQDINAWKQLQQFFISNWKSLQYYEWLKHLLISDLTNLPYSKIDKFLVHQFRARSWEYLDPVKEYSAIKLKLQMKLTDPITEIQKQGYFAEDILDRWKLWDKMLAQRGIITVDDKDTITQEIIKETVLQSIEETKQDG